MNDLVAEGIMLFSAFATIAVMALVILKERRKQKNFDSKKTKKHVQRKLQAESDRLYLN